MRTRERGRGDSNGPARFNIRRKLSQNRQQVRHGRAAFKRDAAGVSETRSDSGVGPAQGGPAVAARRAGIGFEPGLNLDENTIGHQVVNQVRVPQCRGCAFGGDGYGRYRGHCAVDAAEALALNRIRSDLNSHAGPDCLPSFTG